MFLKTYCFWNTGFDDTKITFTDKNGRNRRQGQPDTAYQQMVMALSSSLATCRYFIEPRTMLKDMNFCHSGETYLTNSEYH